MERTVGRGSVQMVILTGELGTRLLCLTSEVPKALIPINGKPFLHLAGIDECS